MQKNWETTVFSDCVEKAQNVCPDGYNLLEPSGTPVACTIRRKNASAEVMQPLDPSYEDSHIEILPIDSKPVYGLSDDSSGTRRTSGQESGS